MRRADREVVEALALLEKLLFSEHVTFQQNGRARKVTNFDGLLMALRKNAVEGSSSAIALLNWARKALPRARAVAHGKTKPGEPFRGGVYRVPKELWSDNLSLEGGKIPSFDDEED